MYIEVIFMSFIHNCIGMHIIEERDWTYKSQRQEVFSKGKILGLVLRNLGQKGEASECSNLVDVVHYNCEYLIHACLFTIIRHEVEHVLVSNGYNIERGLI